MAHHSSQIMVIYYKSQKNLKTELQIDVNSPVFAYSVSILNYHILNSINICKYYVLVKQTVLHPVK